MKSLFTTAILLGLAAGHQASATSITGSIYFGGGFVNNGYDPANGGVPSGYGNANGNTVAVGPGVEFGFQDQFNRDTADFSATTLVLTDTVLSVGASPWQQTFTADTSGYFTGLTLGSSSFAPSLSYAVAGNSLTVNWAGSYASSSATYAATFNLVPLAPPPPAPTPVPEPATFLLLAGAIAFAATAYRQTLADAARGT